MNNDIADVKDTDLTGVFSWFTYEDWIKCHKISSICNANTYF